MPSQKKSNRSRMIAAITGVVLFSLAGFASVIIAAIRNGTDLSHVPVPQHTSLLNKAAINKLPTAFVFRSKIQGALSNYNYPDDFHLAIYQVALKNDQSLSQLLKINDEPPSKSYQVNSPYIDNRFLTMTKSASAVDKVAVVNFRYESPKIYNPIFNDTFAYYHLNFRKFSIGYDNEGNDILAMSNTAVLPSISIAFIKKNKVLYIAMLYKSQHQDERFNCDKLLSMLNR